MVFSSFVSNSNSSFFYKLDPRTKLLSLAVLSILIFHETSVISLLFFLLLTFLFMFLFSISVIDILKTIKPLLFIFFLIFLLRFVFIQKEHTISFISDNKIFFEIFQNFQHFEIFQHFQIFHFLNFENLPHFEYGFISISVYTFFAALFPVLKFFILVLLSSIITQTTNTSKLVLGLERLFDYLPLKKFNISSTDLSLMIFLSLSFIPNLFNTANQISVSAQSRGLVIKKKPVLYIRILSTNLINSILKYSYDISNSMEGRCYTGYGKTSIYELNFNKYDFLFIFLLFLYSFFHFFCFRYFLI
ncbi:MAG: hypothetical protein GX362_03950 [Methanosarcinaceae archaeon]|nr:hypothetical protein [Methanosarcinaceae archaeon]